MSCDNIQPTVATQQYQPHAGHRILVAEDESAVRALMSSVLLRAGYRVDLAQDGAFAWAALQAEPYDLLITDYNMPRINGVELVRNLRAARMDLPVIMATGTPPLQETSQDPSLRLAATLEKPFTVEALLETVGNILRAAAQSPRAESDATLKPPESTTATNAPVDNEINKSSGSLLALAALVLVVAAQHPT